MDFINLRKLSRWLSGGNGSIRINRLPIKHQEAVQEINDFFEQWKKKYPQYDGPVKMMMIKPNEQPEQIQPITENKEKPKQEPATNNEVVKEDTLPAFNNVEPHIAYNKKCYRVSNVLKGVVSEYYYDLEEARTRVKLIASLP